MPFPPPGGWFSPSQVQDCWTKWPDSDNYPTVPMGFLQMHDAVVIDHKFVQEKGINPLNAPMTLRPILNALEGKRRKQEEMM